MFRKITTTLPLVLLLLMGSCQDELPVEHQGEGTETVTLTITAEPGTMVQTRSEVNPSAPESEAAKAGYSYEMKVTSIDSIGPETKALPTSYKNGYALLFTSDGKFNGRASVGTFKAGEPMTVTFTGVANASATDCRLVLIADDVNSTLELVKGSTLSSFSGTYSDFCRSKEGSQYVIINAGKIEKDEDVPYVGSVTGVSLSSGKATVSTISLFRMLAKVSIVINDEQFEMKDGFVTSSIIGCPYRWTCAFGTMNEYDGTGTKDTSENSNKGSMSAGGFDKKSFTMYLGDVYTTTEYIDFSFNYEASTALRNDVQVGEEYCSARYIEFHFYFTDSKDSSIYIIRRNHHYNLTINLRGSWADMLAQSHTDKTGSRDNITFAVGEPPAGLNIGMFGGGNFVTASSALGVTGYYTKYLLLHPNTSGTTATDNVTKQWSTNTTTQYQSDNLKYWDPTYTLEHMDETTGFAYDYCYNLTTGGVEKGTWYVPTQTQLRVICSVLAGLKENPLYDRYSAFGASYSWSATETNASNAWCVNFTSGAVNTNSKTNSHSVRCVRDL